MSKREKFMLFLWFGGPKTAEEIAEHMQLPWREELSVDVLCVLKEKLLYRNFKYGKALYGLTSAGRDHCMRNYRASLDLGRAALTAEKAAAPAVDGTADGDEAMADAVESAGATGGDQDVDVVSTIAEQAEPEAAINDAAEPCDYFLLAIYGDRDGERTGVELMANSNWAADATKIAIDRQAPYRAVLMGDMMRERERCIEDRERMRTALKIARDWLPWHEPTHPDYEGDRSDAGRAVRLALDPDCGCTPPNAQVQPGREAPGESEGGCSASAETEG